jgi:hypothetical protein
MTDRSLSPISATAVRIGRTNLGGGNIVLEDDGISVLFRSTGDEPVRITVESIESVAVLGNELTLTLNDGAKVAFSATGSASQFANAILTRCRALPELTRTLRTFGSRRGTRSTRESSAADQRRFFAPLLEARRVAGGTRVPAAAIAAFDAPTLRQTLIRVLRQFAAERQSEEGPVRRALEAELDEIIEPLMAAIAALGDAAEDARVAVDDLRMWREWAGQVRATFEAADRVWISLDAALDAAPLPP